MTKSGSARTPSSAGGFQTSIRLHLRSRRAAGKAAAGHRESSTTSFVGQGRSRAQAALADIEPLAQGRVWLGSQAKPRGLVDELGGLDKAIEMVRDKAKISSSEKIVLVTYPPKRTVWDVLFKGTDETSQMESHLRPFIGKLPLRALAHGGILRLMPFTVDVK